MKQKKPLIVVSVLLVVVLYGVRVYHVNHSTMLENMPNKIIYEAGTRVEMVAGFYNYGYADLTGYHLQVTGTRLVKTEELLAEYGMSMDYLERMHVTQNFQYTYIVTAVFDYEGDTDPLEKVVDLSYLKVVGLDYYYDFSTEINQLKGVNTKLDGNFMFSIGSGKPIEIELPFLINTESEWSVSPEYLVNSNPKLLISAYPEEIYIEL